MYKKGMILMLKSIAGLILMLKSIAGLILMLKSIAVYSTLHKKCVILHIGGAVENRKGSKERTP